MKKNYKCCVPGCDRVAKVWKHKLCNTHLVRYYRNGTTLDHKGRTEIKPKLRDKFATYKPKSDTVTKYQKHNPYGVKHET
jgi:hypothetical protein